MTLDDYVSVDLEALASECMTDDAIVESVQCSSQPVSTECKDMNSEDPHPVVTVEEAEGALHTLPTFLEHYDYTTYYNIPYYY